MRWVLWVVPRGLEAPWMVPLLRQQKLSPDLSLLHDVNSDCWLLLQELGRSVDNKWYGIILILLLNIIHRFHSIHTYWDKGRVFRKVVQTRSRCFPDCPHTPLHCPQRGFVSQINSPSKPYKPFCCSFKQNETNTLS